MAPATTAMALITSFVFVPLVAFALRWKNAMDRRNRVGAYARDPFPPAATFARTLAALHRKILRLLLLVTGEMTAVLSVYAFVFYYAVGRFNPLFVLIGIGLVAALAAPGLALLYLVVRANTMDQYAYWRLREESMSQRQT